MNYLNKNLKTLRKKYQLTQERFGSLFGLNQPQVRSYEAGSDPGTAKVIEITEHFGLNAVKFVQFDMEKMDVSKAQGDEETSDQVSSPDRLMDIPGIQTIHKYSFVDELSPDKIRKLCKDLLIEKDNMVKERIEMQTRIIQLQEELLNKK
ncbi:MAG: helix-turn-helix transcriptional regulator [Cytophagales bacterium]|nr:helix-turn-helix transcriptional regulator [Cytophagales bacterium]